MCDLVGAVSGVYFGITSCEPAARWARVCEPCRMWAQSCEPCCLSRPAERLSSPSQAEQSDCSRALYFIWLELGLHAGQWRRNVIQCDEGLTCPGGGGGGAHLTGRTPWCKPRQSDVTNISIGSMPRPKFWLWKWGGGGGTNISLPPPHSENWGAHAPLAPLVPTPVPGILCVTVGVCGGHISIYNKSPWRLLDY